MSVTATSSTTATTQTQTTSSTSSTDNTSLGKDDFLKLLCVQLQNQNPLDPMKDTEFIAQMASFSSLEQMQNLNTSFTTLSTNISDNLIPGILLQQSSALIGSQVTYNNPDTTSDADQILTGVIEAVQISDGKPVYIINGQNVSSDDIIEIGQTTDQTSI